jgi:hypothetical protein
MCDGKPGACCFSGPGCEVSETAEGYKKLASHKISPRHLKYRALYLQDVDAWIVNLFLRYILFIIH